MSHMKIKIWQRSDIDGFFGLFTNNLTNLLVMAGLLLSIGIPADIALGSILPAVGLSIFTSSIIYSMMAYQLAKKENRNDVTSLPSGTSVTHMFLIVYLIIGPVYQKTGDPYLAWYASLAWGFLEGVIELIGSFFGQRLKNIIPRAAMLGSLAGVSIAFIAMSPIMQVFGLPYIGFVSLGIVLLGWFGDVEFPFKLPVGLVAILVGTAIGWATGLMDVDNLIASFGGIELLIPTFSVNRLIEGFSEATPFLASAIPLGLYNMFETIDNLEGAEASGDFYDTKKTMIADGATSILGSLFGNPFPTAVFIGHAGWKKAGARIGYTIATGIVLVFITWLGLIELLLNIIPLEAILPILIYVGLIVGSQAFQETEKKYAPAVILALIPWLADWGKTVIGNAFTAANVDPASIPMENFSNAGLQYEGMLVLSGGSIIVSMIWASILVFIIDQEFNKAAITSVIGGALSFVGIIHSATVGFGVGITLTVSYLVLSVLFVVVGYSENRRKLK